MKLILIADKVHKASRLGTYTPLGRMPSPACNPKKHTMKTTGIISSWEGAPSEITCKKCAAIVERLGTK